MIKGYSASPKLLRKVLEWNLAAAAGKSLIDGSTQCFAALAYSKCNDRANNETADAPQRNAFEEHAVAKKCHRCHLFHKVLLQVHNSFCFAPEMLDPIVFPFFWTEYMDNDITKVQEHPTCVSTTFAVKQSSSLFP